MILILKTYLKIRFFLSKSLKFFSLVVILFLPIACKKHNPNNFTLITFGYGGIYNGLEADPAKGRASQIVAERWTSIFIGEDANIIVILNGKI